MKKEEIVFCEITIYTDREIPLVEKYLATEGEKVYLIKNSYGSSRLKKNELMVPKKECAAYKIWCLEKDKKQAVKILYNFAILHSKEGLEEAQKVVENIEKIDITHYTMRDNTIPLKPFKGELKL
jgi:hypothetical protein